MTHHFARRAYLTTLALAVAAAPAAAQGGGAARAPARVDTVVLRAARLVDGTGAAPVANGVLVVAGDRIVAVGRAASAAVPPGARTVDLGDATLLPGFIDAHTRIIRRTPADPGADDATVRDLPGYAAVYKQPPASALP